MKPIKSLFVYLVVAIGSLSQIHAQSALTSGLVAYFPFNGNANDASANNWSTFSTGVSPSTGRFGNPSGALYFNGTNGFVQFQTSSPIASGARTITTWANFRNLNRFTGPPYGQEWTCILNAGTHMAFYINSATNTPQLLRFDEGGGYYQDVSVAQIMQNVWCHLAATYDLTNVCFYLNGTLLAKKPLSVPILTGWGTNLIIGAYASEYNLDGSLSGTRIYNRALSSNEVAQLYDFESTPPAGFETNGLVAYYPFIGNANDASAYHNNPTLNTATPTIDEFGMPSHAYAFGNSQYIRCDDAPQLSFDAQTSFGVFAWIESTNNLADYSGIVSKMFPDGIPQTQGFQMTLVGNKLNIEVGVGIVNVHLQGNTILNDGKWHAVGFVLNRASSSVQLFVDGKLDGTIIDSHLTNDLSNTDPLLFGVSRNVNTFFIGSINNIRIYNRSLSSQEITRLAFLEGPEVLNIKRAVYLDSQNLKVGSLYQVQVSSDLLNWTNYGSVFTATNSIWRTTNYWDVDNWSQFYFRIQHQ